MRVRIAPDENGFVAWNRIASRNVRTIRRSITKTVRRDWVRGFPPSGQEKVAKMGHGNELA
jgi:hypothetical protein